MAIFKVSSTAQLTAAVKIAKAGDTISLASGTYAGVALRGIAPTGTVTITSADAGKPAVFTDLAVRSSANLTFSNVVLDSKPSPLMNQFEVRDSIGIHFDHIVAKGNVLGSEAIANGLMIRGSQNVSVTNSEFHDLQVGVSLLDNTGVVVSNSFFHDIRTDGVRGGGNSNLVVRDNAFTNFHPAAGDHPDAVQLWTTGTTVAAKNIEISGNVVVRGKGDPVQGIFLRDQVGNLPYENVKITDNIVIGSMANGIGVYGEATGTITGNVVLGLPDQKSLINAGEADGLRIAGNVATNYNVLGQLAPVDNSLVLTPQDGGWAALASWLGSHGDKGGITDASFLAATGMSAPAASLATTSAPTAQPAPTAPYQQTVYLNGTSGADRLVADKLFASELRGGAGDDVLTGNGLSSKLIGGTGDDTYTVKSAGDVVIENAGEGTDTVTAYLDYILGNNVENLRLAGDARVGTGNALDNRIVGGTGNDTLSGLGGNDSIQGGDGNDRLLGGDGNDTLRGDAGDDVIEGGAGNDQLYGGDGNDQLNGGDGVDVIEGGAGNDILSGGAGADVFRFRDESVAARDVDTIRDFVRGSDKIDLGAIDARIGGTANDSFQFIGSSAFHNKAGELQAKAVTGGMQVAGDVNGDGVADFVIFVQGATTLQSSDFVL